MIKTIIVDDEKKGAEVLQLMLENHCPNIKVVAVEYSAMKAIDAINTHKPDLVFLDIEMPKATGFDVIEATKSHEYKIIFTTAYEQYAIKAVKVNAFDYLLKPIDIEELMAAVSNFEAQFNSKNTSRIEDTISQPTPVYSKTKRISIPTQEGLIFLDSAEIIRLEAESNYTQLYLKNKKKITVSKTLKYFEDLLNKNEFCRVHNAHIINLSEIDRYIRGDGGIVVLSDSANIPVSRTYKADLIDKLM